MAPSPMKPHDASRGAEQENCLIPRPTCEKDRRRAEDNRVVVISVELA